MVSRRCGDGAEIQRLAATLFVGCGACGGRNTPSQLKNWMKLKHISATSVDRYYCGHSMKGTFRDGDLLVVQTTRLNALQPGDVVVFTRQSSVKRQEIVHRVVRRTSDGVATRGDAVACEDTGLVNESNLVGTVFCRIRNGRLGHVHGGSRGLIRGRCLHLYNYMRRWMVRISRKPYRILRDSGIAGCLWKPHVIRVMIKSKDGPCVQFISKQQIVARHWPEIDRFECKKPWDLVIGRHPFPDR